MTFKKLGLVALTAIAFTGSTVLADARPGQGGQGGHGAGPSAHFSGGASRFSGGSRVSNNVGGARMSGSQFSGARMSSRSNFSGGGRNYSFRRGGGRGYGVGLGLATGLALGAGYGGYGYGYGYDEPYYSAYGDDDSYGDGYVAYGSGECWIQRRAVIDQFGFSHIRRVRVCG